MKNEFAKKWKGASDSVWLTALISSTKEPTVEGVRFPRFPSGETQRFVHGSFSDEVSVRGAFRFYQEVRRASETAGCQFDENRTLLDFGTGWGRIVRPFMRDFSLARIYAAEPSEELCVIARELNSFINIVNSDYSPPLPFRSGMFDYITAYSIFSHFPAELFESWFREFYRLLKPGGLVCFTILGVRLLNELQVEAASPVQDIHFWHKILIDHLPPFDEARARLVVGELLFLRTQQGANYGDAFVTPKYLEGRFGDQFDIVHANLADMAQDFVCMRKVR